jgi:recombination protein RecA
MAIVSGILSDESSAALESFKAKITKKYGDGIISDAKVTLDEEQTILSVGPILDLALGGGIPQGSWVIFSGPPKCGKTTLSLQIAKRAQDIGMPVIYLDVEGRWKKLNVTAIEGLNPELVHVIRSKEGTILSAEEYLTSATDALKSVPGCLLIIDSTSALCSQKELTDDITGQSRSLGPKILSSFCKQMGGVVPIQKSIVIMIQHLIANTSGFGAPYMEDGGRKVQYQVDTKIRAKGTKNWEDGDSIVGIITNWSVECSALGAPGKKAESYIRFGYGVDKEREIAQLALDLGILRKKGSWYRYGEEESETEEKAQGMNNFCQLLVEKPDVFTRLKDDVYALL